MDDRTPDWVNESFNAVPVGTLLSDGDVDTGWMVVSTDATDNDLHKFGDGPVPTTPPGVDPDQFGDGVHLELGGHGAITFKLKAGVRLLVHSGWLHGKESEVRFRYLGADGLEIETRTLRPKSAPSYVFNTTARKEPDIWGLEIQFSKAVGNQVYVMDNFWSAEPSPEQTANLKRLADGSMSPREWLKR
ncbi:MAG TPA: hypothetical protein VM621_11855 [Luteibacter sp.]|uniref:hypothetical protein n=1 Tax=Luteibacter sp. TaxID=1886636 RepID=UPI002BA7ABBA|nr:hypothetical protein [Luteibacter sp.]HVI55728.1 hypothetical protein [Luteibacter sp.]